MNSKKLAVILPGTGYNKDKPLLYYSITMFTKKGYEICYVDYSNYFAGVNYRDPDQMNAVTGKAYDYAADILDKVHFDEYDKIVFIGKSFGTLVGAKYASERGLAVYQIWYTPVMETYEYANGDIIAFMGDNDPMAEVGAATEKAKENNIPLHIYPNANHSLATGDALTDIDTLRDVMRCVDEIKF